MFGKTKIYINHLGFLCHAAKQARIEPSDHKKFVIQNLAYNAEETLSGGENWQVIFEGKLVEKNTAQGKIMLADFSEITRPGVYRIALPDLSSYSAQFIITDGVFAPLLRMLLDGVHLRRAGNFENEWRGPATMDDAVFDNSGKYKDVSGGWYDAGDLRKWMTMSTLPAAAFVQAYQKLDMQWNHYAAEQVAPNDLITEAAWGIDYILSMQDELTGMFYEDVAGGGTNRKTENSVWWVDNHAGCYADNADNRFTDNKLNSGDERKIRTTYNPIVQYVNQYVLVKTYQEIQKYQPQKAAKMLEAAKRNQQFLEGVRESDSLHTWASVKSWRLILALERIYVPGFENEKEAPDALVQELTDLYSEDFHFWFMDEDKKEPYRGVLQSAQPLIALCMYLDYFPEGKKSGQVKALINDCFENYVVKMCRLNKFGIVPYGLYSKPATENETYRPLDNGYFYRMYMPDNPLHGVNHGLGGHWTSWSHALAYAGSLLHNDNMKKAAWDQLFWLLGANPFHSCMVSGLGYNSPVPHSRFFGTFPGGFCVGPRGTTSDEPFVDMNGSLQWNSTEYWNTPVTNTFFALSYLLPSHIKRENKLGFS